MYLLKIEYMTGLNAELEYPNHVRPLKSLGGTHSYKK